MTSKPVSTQDLREFFTKRNPDPSRAVFERDMAEILAEFVNWVEEGKPDFLPPLSEAQRTYLITAKSLGLEITPEQERQLAARKTPKGFA
jgi:hypothetical protein